MDMKELKFKDEIQKMEYEPLAPVEIKLVRTSLILGIVLLIFFYFLSNALFKHEAGTAIEVNTAQVSNK